jgi:hypothetical protein
VYRRAHRTTEPCSSLRACIACVPLSGEEAVAVAQLQLQIVS